MTQERQEPDEQAMIDYLLGNLSDDSRERFEQRYFVDDDVFLKLEPLETELIRRYVKGELTASQRVLFEKNFLTGPGRRQRLDLARDVHALAGTMSRETPARLFSLWRHAANRPVPAMAFAGVTFLLLAGVAGLGLYTLRLQSESERIEAERQRTHQEWSTAMRRHLGAASATGEATALFAVTPGLTRSGGEDQRIEVGPSVKLLTLELKLTDSPASPAYRAALRTADGEAGKDELLIQSGLLPSGTGTDRAVLLSVPAHVLSETDYVLTLSGDAGGGDYQPILSYSFEIVFLPR